MKVKPYEKLAEVYDDLMKKVDYESWSKYILEISKNYVTNEAMVLELAAGNCRMADLLSRNYRYYVCSDISQSMLKTGSIKLQKVCCNMTQLPFNTKFDFVFSAFDSVNYILKKKMLLRLFKEVYSILTDDGIFTFDASLETNSLKFLIKETTESIYNGFLYVRTNVYNKWIKTHYNKIILSHRSNSVFKETHKQKIYDLTTYFELAENAGFYTDACYKCFSFEEANSGSERAQFVMRKVNL